MLDPSRWISDRARRTEVSGIRRVFDLGRSLPDPINLSIGQPHFAVPEPIREAAKRAIDAGQNGYTPTQGAGELRERIAGDLAARFAGQSRPNLVTSGTSGGLLLAMLAVVNPGDEVVVPDPYFVAYPNLVELAGGVSVPVVCDPPDFAVDPGRVADAITPRTKVVLLCSPANPTGAVTPPESMRQIADICRERNVLLVSDEIYRAFHYDAEPRSPAEFSPDVLVIEGFGKTYGLTGWRLGYAHGPKAVIEEMTKLQQFSFVCAPSFAQHACVAAMDFDVAGIVADYKRKRDRLAELLRDDYEFGLPGGAFYLFPKLPTRFRTGVEFVQEAVRRNLLVIPGSVFSARDTHFRISYAAEDATLERGAAVLSAMARGKPD